MAILRLVTKPGTNRGPIFSPGGIRAWERTYIVTVDVQYDGIGWDIMADRRLPQRGTLHPNDAGARLISIDPRPHPEKELVWEIEYKWSSQHGQPEQDQPPLERPPQITGNFVPSKKVRFFDLDLKAFNNSAGTPLNPPPECPDHLYQLTIQRYEEAFVPSVDQAYKNACNTDRFWWAKKYHALMNDIIVDVTYEDGKPYFHKTYVILFGDEPFIPTEILDQGPVFLNEDGKEELPQDTKKRTYNGQVPLNGVGGLLPEGDRKAGNFKYNKFRLYKKQPFAPLRLG
jgi:hypothetical protein